MDLEYALEFFKMYSSPSENNYYCYKMCTFSAPMVKIHLQSFFVHTEMRLCWIVTVTSAIEKGF